MEPRRPASVTKRRASLAIWMLSAGLMIGIAGCASSPSASTSGSPQAQSAASDTQETSDDPDAAAIAALAGVYDVSIAVTGSGGAATATSVSAREAVLVEAGNESGQWVVEHLLLVGQPPAVARHWSSVWTATQDGRWRIVENEADGRPSSVVVGRWVHESLPGAAAAGSDGRAGVLRFLPDVGSVRTVTTRMPGIPGMTGRWWASTTLRVGPGLNWTRTTEGQRVGADGRPLGGAMTRTEAYVPTAVGEAEALSAAEDWWSARRAFWSAVRGWWSGRDEAEVRDAVDGVPMWRAVLDLEAAVRRGQAEADMATLDAVLGAYVAE